MEYGVTDNGFVLKRLDTITEEIHAELSEAYGFDTRLIKNNWLDVLVTTFGVQIAELWEQAQEEYFSKFPATATGYNLDNAVQFGGVLRSAARASIYPIHCMGVDGTTVPKGTLIATDSNPEIQLKAAYDFNISRENCNALSIVPAVLEQGVYSITINETPYSYFLNIPDIKDLLNGLKSAIIDEKYNVYVENDILYIIDTEKSRQSNFILTDNLTTVQVASIANFATVDYGAITIPDGLITKIINNISGFNSVQNILAPSLGRDRETDTELRRDYIKKSALRSTTMVGSICADLLNNVANIETATGYENDKDIPDSEGRPPHSIEIIVEGGNETDIAETILNRKAGGIQTYGDITVKLLGQYGDQMTIRFNRPRYLYTWLRVTISGNKSQAQAAYSRLTIESIVHDCKSLVAGDDLLIQLLEEGIYNSIAGISYVRIETAHSEEKAFIPTEYIHENIIVTSREKVLVDASRIEVIFNDI